MMFVAMFFATTLTYAYMGLAEVGININTVPIIAVGVGVGIDYSIYMMDRIREEMVRRGDLRESVRAALRTTGLVLIFKPKFITQLSDDGGGIIQRNHSQAPSEDL